MVVMVVMVVRCDIDMSVTENGCDTALCHTVNM